MAECLQEGAVTLLSGGVAVAPRAETGSGELGQCGLRRLSGVKALGCHRSTHSVDIQCGIFAFVMYLGLVESKSGVCSAAEGMGLASHFLRDASCCWD